MWFLISLNEMLVLGSYGRICLCVEHVTNSEQLYSWVFRIWSVGKRGLAVAQVLSSFDSHCKTVKYPSLFLLLLLFLLLSEVYYNTLKIGQKFTSEAIYLLVNIFTVAVFSSIIIYKHLFLGQIYWQEFSQSGHYLHTFQHCLCL